MSGHKMPKETVIEHLVNRYEVDQKLNSTAFSKKMRQSSKATGSTTWTSPKRRTTKTTYSISIPRGTSEIATQAATLLRRMKTLKNHQAISIADAAMVLGTTANALNRRLGRSERAGITSPFHAVSSAHTITGFARRETSGLALFMWAEAESSRGRSNGYALNWRCSSEAYRHAATYLN